ncbi:MAG: putative 2OG-Fe(II) oxygenase, partial [Alteraurantiacibacter sp.]
LALDPQRVRALQGRATVALERGEADAVDRFDRALARDASDPYQWYARAQALDAAGRADEARHLVETLLAKIPHWHDALRLFAQLRLAAGEEDFASHYGKAAQQVPHDVGIRSEWALALHRVERHCEAAEVILEARRDFPQDARLPLMEAIYASDGGESERAEALFGSLAIDSEERWIHEARHAVRRGEMDRAAFALDHAEHHAPFSVALWALRGILWRLADDPRADWLHEQAGLVQLLPLRNAETVLPPAIAMLEKLHDISPFPLGQSLRGGTQTRGGLFDRTEPELARVHEAVLATLEDYRAGLPAPDPTHPLLRERKDLWRIAGSWSVRLSGGADHHAAHIHPQGLLSSALYCALPEAHGEDPQAGWLELGCPPLSLGLDLGPLLTIEPREGHLALFPSTLYHGTRPFKDGQRMTVAFDVVASGAKA